MKRTKQTFFRYHPDWQHRETISGCRQFDGEDLQFDSRNKYFKNKQKQWLDQQVKDKKARDNYQKQVQQMYANQTFELNRMRGMLQDNFTDTKNQIKSNVRDQNQFLAKQRKDLQKYQKDMKLQFEKEEVRIMQERGRKQQFGMNIQ